MSNGVQVDWWTQPCTSGFSPNEFAVPVESPPMGKLQPGGSLRHLRGANWDCACFPRVSPRAIFDSSLRDAILNGKVTKDTKTQMWKRKSLQIISVICVPSKSAPLCKGGFFATGKMPTPYPLPGSNLNIGYSSVKWADILHFVIERSQRKGRETGAMKKSRPKAALFLPAEAGPCF